MLIILLSTSLIFLCIAWFIKVKDKSAETAIKEVNDRVDKISIVTVIGKH